MPAIRRAIVIFKKSAYQIYVRERHEARVRRLLEGRDPVVAHMRRVDRDQERCMTAVTGALRRLQIAYDRVYRARPFRAASYDLVVSVGGDGTLLEASHHVGATPVLSVNSSPRTSVGYFSTTTAESFHERMEEIVSGALRAVALQRMGVERNGRPVGPPVLNDVLFASDNPAATSRYILEVGTRSEEQKSSGLWIATAAGSTAALRSAGGTVLPAQSRRIAYVVREPYHDPGARLLLLGGSVAPGTTLSVMSKMRQSALYVDGSHVAIPLRLGDRVTFRLHPEPLRILGFARR